MSRAFAISLFALLVSCGSQPDERQNGTVRTSTANSSNSSATTSATLLCRGGGDSKLTASASGVQFQFTKSTQPVSKETVQPGFCGWSSAGMTASDPQIFLQPNATDVVVTGGVAESKKAPWVKQATDANTVFMFDATRDAKGAIIVSQCSAMLNAPLAAGSATLTWSEKIDSKKFGLPANPSVDGKTLQEIVSSAAVGRDDGQLCSACHNSAEAMGDYGVPVAKNEKSVGLKPTDLVGGKPWAGEGGWAEGFAANSTKPDNLKALMKAWMAGGFKP